MTAIQATRANQRAEQTWETKPAPPPPVAESAPEKKPISLEARRDARAVFNESGSPVRALPDLDAAGPRVKTGLRGDAAPAPAPGPDDDKGPKTIGNDDLRRRQAIEDARKNGGPVPFTNSDGVTEDVTLVGVVNPNGDTGFRVTVGSDSFNVFVDKGLDQDKVLASVIDSYSETPAELRRAVHEVEVTTEPGAPIETTDNPDDRTGAQAADGKITFFNGEQNLGAFHHEAAHLFGGEREQAADHWWNKVGEAFVGDDPVPPGYADVAKKDGNFTSPYAEDASSATNYTEDFADAWQQYMDATDKGPAAVEEYRNKYPNRTRWIEENLPKPTSAYDG